MIRCIVCDALLHARKGSIMPLLLWSVACCTGPCYEALAERIERVLGKALAPPFPVATDPPKLPGELPAWNPLNG